VYDAFSREELSGGWILGPGCVHAG
jgi:hypothetical protein